MQASAGLHTNINGTRSRIPVGQYKIGRIAQEARVRFSNRVSDEADVDDQDGCGNMVWSALSVTP